MSENEYQVMKGDVWVKALLKEKRINGEWIVWEDSNALLHYSRGDVSHSVSSSYELMMEVGPVTRTESESLIISSVSVYICY